MTSMILVVAMVIAAIVFTEWLNSEPKPTANTDTTTPTTGGPDETATQT